MSVRTLIYAFKEGIINLFKNRLMSLASIGTITACLIVVNVFYIVGTNVAYMIEEVQNNIGIAVFFDDYLSEAEILNITDIIKLRPEVYSVTYTSPEEAWESFKVDYFDGREELLAGFEGANPLEDSASLQVYLADITKQGELVDFINSIEGIRHIREDREITDVIKTINQLIRYISIALISILLLISLFLISNTVRIGIEVRKKQINIMKFIGATDTFISGPFVVEGALIGALGSIIPLIIIYYTYNDITTTVIDEFYLLNKYLKFVSVTELLQILAPLSLGIGIAIGIFGSMITIRKHLKV